MKGRILIVILFLLGHNLYAQKYDYLWVLGDPGGNTDVIFTDTNVEAINHHRNIEMDNGQTTISDSAGNLQFFTNCARIYNRNDSIMQNGDSLNYGNAWNQFFGGVSYDALEDIAALPTDTNGVWNLIHYASYYMETAPFLYNYRIEESKVDMRGDSGLGAVIYKNKVLIQDTIGSYATACQHANGRDWWVLDNKTGTNCLFTLLVEPDTVIQYPMQCLGSNYANLDAGQAAFSPDGSKFAWVGGYGGVNIYNFDRCSGLLSNPIHIPVYWNFTDTTNDINYQYGLAFSPNSQFLYTTQSNYIFQFDLTNDSTAQIVDTIGRYAAPPDSNSFPGTYFLMQLAPDGKIYISANNSIRWLHVIKQPDKRGDSCNFVNYGFALPNENSFGLPSYPGNYRLGALHGSPCDTLTKTDTTSVGFVKINRENILKVYPNPATGYVIIDYGYTDWSMGTNVNMEISDAIGQVIYTQALPMYSGFQKLEISQFASGMYTVFIKRNHTVIATQKLVKQ